MKYKLQKFTCEQVNNLNSPISFEEIEFVLKNLPQKKILPQMASLVKYIKHLETMEDIMGSTNEVTTNTMWVQQGSRIENEYSKSIVFLYISNRNIN